MHILSVDFIFFSPYITCISQGSTRVLFVVGNQVLSKHTAVIIVIFKGHHKFFIEEPETTAVIIIIFKGHYKFFIEEHETRYRAMGK